MKQYIAYEIIESGKSFHIADLALVWKSIIGQSITFIELEKLIMDRYEGRVCLISPTKIKMSKLVVGIFRSTAADKKIDIPEPYRTSKSFESSTDHDFIRKAATKIRDIIEANLLERVQHSTDPLNAESDLPVPKTLYKFISEIMGYDKAAGEKIKEKITFIATVLIFNSKKNQYRHNMHVPPLLLDYGMFLRYC
jgi:hypothetical protein